MNRVLLRNGALLDTVSGEILGDRDVLVDGDRIVEISPTPIQSESTASFDLRGRVLMPGLCDAHVHVAAVTADLPAIHHMPVSYVTAGAAQIMRAMLMRGFTTVRDGGGADYGMALAVEEGQLIGPRILFSGHALSQTGGHGDWRSKGDHSMDGCACSAVYGRICDGVPELRKAARDEIRKGASQIKIMASGGLSSPTDRADGVQFAMEEIKAAVEEADAAGIYVMAHAAPARAVKRALQFGVRSIEHGHYMDEECLDLLIEKQAFYVPTMAIRYTLLREGLEAGFPAVSHAKLLAATGGTIEQSQRVFERAHRRGIKMVYGTDLLGILHKHQTIEMDLRADVESPAEVIRAATLHAAELFQRAGEIGVVAVGARADLLVVDGDPLRDLGLLQHQGRHLKLIMKGGEIYKNEL